MQAMEESKCVDFLTSKRTRFFLPLFTHKHAKIRALSSSIIYYTLYRRNDGSCAVRSLRSI